MGKRFLLPSPVMASGGSSRLQMCTTGYLQVEQRVPVYAYLPFHHGFSNLSYEALAELRMTLLEILKEEGIEGIKRLARKLKRERRDRPKSVLQLKKSIYGIPDAGLLHVHPGPAHESMRVDSK